MERDESQITHKLWFITDKVYFVIVI